MRMISGRPGGLFVTIFLQEHLPGGMAKRISTSIPDADFQTKSGWARANRTATSQAEKNIRFLKHCAAQCHPAPGRADGFAGSSKTGNAAHHSAES